MHSSGHGFFHHLQEAIACNRMRGAIYAELSDGKSQWLTTKLIFLERITCLVAGVFDWLAHRYHLQGINLFNDDFMSFKNLPAVQTPPLYSGQASLRAIKRLDSMIRRCKENFQCSVNQGKFLEAAAGLHHTLHFVKIMEEENKCHFAMTRHLLESMGWSALHADQHAKSSEGKTISLSKWFLWFQSLGLYESRRIDQQAQSIHQLGLGILVNDLPYIPFEEDFLQLRNSLTARNRTKRT